jgi:hypothetical protein
MQHWQNLPSFAFLLRVLRVHRGEIRLVRGVVCRRFFTTEDTENTEQKRESSGITFAAARRPGQRRAIPSFPVLSVFGG